MIPKVALEPPERDVAKNVITRFRLVDRAVARYQHVARGAPHSVPIATTGGMTPVRHEGTVVLPGEDGLMGTRRRRPRGSGAGNGSHGRAEREDLLRKPWNATVSWARPARG